MRNIEKYNSIVEDNLDETITNKMIEELDNYQVFRGPDFDDKLINSVGELRDRGVEIGGFLGSSRRIVFKGKYNEKDVAIKFSHALHTINHDERQQQKEEMIWRTALKEGKDFYFAEILFGDISSNYVVQEYCEDVTSVDYEDLPADYQKISEEYNLYELQIGTNIKNNTVFVDYGC